MRAEHPVQHRRAQQAGADVPRIAESKFGLRARAGNENRALLEIGTRGKGGESGSTPQGSTTATKA